MNYKYTRKHIARQLKFLYPNPCTVRDLVDDLLAKQDTIIVCYFI